MRIQMANDERRATATSARRLMPAQAEATPMAAPIPNNHQAAIAAYDRVVEANPPFAYDSAKTAAATATATAMSRRKLFSAFTNAGGTGSYSSAVLGGLRRLVLGGLVAGVMLWAPTAAFACG